MKSLLTHSFHFSLHSIRNLRRLENESVTREHSVRPAAALRPEETVVSEFFTDQQKLARLFELFKIEDEEHTTFGIEGFCFFKVTAPLIQNIIKNK